MKMQDAFVGSFEAIGYKMNDGTVFHYTDGFPTTDANKGTTAIPTTLGTAGWTATAQIALNECTTNPTWVLFPAKADDGAGLKWGAGIKKGGAATSATDADVDCSVLTTSFKTLAK